MPDQGYEALREQLAAVTQAFERASQRNELLQQQLCSLGHPAAADTCAPAHAHGTGLELTASSAAPSSPSRTPCGCGALGEPTTAAAHAPAAVGQRCSCEGQDWHSPGWPNSAMHPALVGQRSGGTSLGRDGAQPGRDGQAAAGVEQQRQAEEEEGDDVVVLTRAEHEMLLLKERALDVLQDGVTIADCRRPDMPLVYASAGFSRLTGYSASDAIMGRNCRFMQGPNTEPQVVLELSRAIAAGQACTRHVINYKRNGDQFVNGLTVTPLFDATGELTHFVGTQSDATELVDHQRAEVAAKNAALQAASATEAKSQFLARMSHEIRTPLNGMIAVGQLLAETSLSPAQWDLVNTIRCSGETLLTLITDILDFSRIEANKMVLHIATFRLKAVVEASMEIAGLRAAQKRLQMAYNISLDTPCMLMGDAQRLQQVLLNVLNNAVKFTESGEVLLEVWPEYIATAAAAPPGSVVAWADLARANCVPPGSGGTTGGTPPPPVRTVSTASAVAAVASAGAALASPVAAAAAPPPPVLFADADAEWGAGLAIPLPLCSLSLDGRPQGGVAALLPCVSCISSPALLGPATAPSSPGPSAALATAAAAAAPCAAPHVPPRGAAAFPSRATTGVPPFVGAPPTSRPLPQALLPPPLSDDAGSPPLTSRSVGSSGAAAAAAEELTACLLHFSVRDSGIGISHQDQAKLFNSFTQVDSARTRRYGGSGLGLAISKRLCEAMGGTLWVESDGPGCGSAFRGTVLCRVPRAAPTPTPTTTSVRRSSQLVADAKSAWDSPELVAPAAADEPIGAPAAAPRCTLPGHCTTHSHGSASSLFDTSLASPEEPLFTVAAAAAAAACLLCGGSAGATGAPAAAAAAGHCIVPLPPLQPPPTQRYMMAAALRAQPPLLRSPSASLSGGGGGGGSGASGGLASAPTSASSLPAPFMALQVMAAQQPQPYDATQPLLLGKRVLLLEPCTMVRQALMLSLRSWGCLVCVADSEQQAMARLLGASTAAAAAAAHGVAPAPGVSMGNGDGDPVRAATDTTPAAALGARATADAAAAATARRRMRLEHCGVLEEQLFSCSGPFDVVLLDMTSVQLLQALVLADEREAARLVFLGWPGQNELEVTHETATSPRRLSGKSSTEGLFDFDLAGTSSPAPPQPSRALGATMERPHARQLGYVTVTRPLRQGRLRVALEEVLQMDLGGVGNSRGRGTRRLDVRPHATATTADALDEGAYPDTSVALSPRVLYHHTGLAGGGALSHLPILCPALFTKSASVEKLDRLALASGGGAMPASMLGSGGGSDHHHPQGSSGSSFSNGVVRAKSAGPADSVRILVAEDNAINMKVALGILRRLGFTNIVTAENGVEAMAAMQARGGPDAFDLLLLDLHMPEMGGMEMMHELQQHWPRRRVEAVAVTADAFEDTRDACLAAGFNGWLPKPFHIEDLLRVVSEHTKKLRAKS